MPGRVFGSTGLEVSTIGFGAAGLSCGARPSQESARAILQQLVADGIRFIDTAPTYCPGPGELHHNERLIADALRQTRDSGGVIVATKGGAVRTAAGGWEIDGHPERLFAGIVASYAALGGREPIPLWQHHWPDPRHSIAATMRVARRAVDEKLVRFVGVCNYTIDQIEEARDAVNIVSVQNQFNLWRREAEWDGLLEYCDRAGLMFLPWRPLGGPGLAERLGEISTLAAIAADRSVSPQRIALAWLLGKASCVMPIPGSRSVEHVRDGLAAADLRLTPGERQALDQLQPSELAARDRSAAWEHSPPLSPAP
jgi:pyridoxine 4-dehydrogenase